MWHENVDLLAYHDLDGRSGLKLALQEVDGHFFLHVAGFWHSGWSIREVTDAEHPELLRFLKGPPNTMTLQVQVADGTMITALEHPPSGLVIGDPAAKPKDGFLIWAAKQLARMRRCENPKCKAVFYDDSRPGLRRWCAPNRCGDRIRTRTYRERHRS